MAGGSADGGQVVRLSHGHEEQRFARARRKRVKQSRERGLDAAIHRQHLGQRLLAAQLLCCEQLGEAHERERVAAAEVDQPCGDLLRDGDIGRPPEHGHGVIDAEPAWLESRQIDVLEPVELVGAASDEAGHRVAVEAPEDEPQRLLGRSVEPADIVDGQEVSRILDLDEGFVQAYALDPVSDRAAVLAYAPSTAEDVLHVLDLSGDGVDAATRVVTRFPSRSRDQKQAARRPGWLAWTRSGQVARVSGPDLSVMLLDGTDASVVCEWRASFHDGATGYEDGRWLSPMEHVPADALVASLGPRLMAAHVAGGPFVTVGRFVPEPEGPVVVLPAFDATALLGEPEPCRRPDEPTGDA